MSTTKIATISRSSRSISSKGSRGKLTGYGKPILSNVSYTVLQIGSYAASIYSMVVALFTISQSIFEIYCLAMAEPGQTHYGYYIISFDFIYSGNTHIRRTLMACAVLSLLLALPLFFTSCILLVGLRKEYEQRFQPWLLTMLVFTGWRVIAYIFSSIVNDMIYGYHVGMLIIWLLITLFNVFCWVVVYSNFQELSNVTRLEDMAKLKMGTISSLNTSHASHHSMHSVHSHSNSRPTTPSAKGSSSTAIA